MSRQELVTLNVGGKIFTTQLKQFPASRLACMLDGGDRDFKIARFL